MFIQDKEQIKIISLQAQGEYKSSLPEVSAKRQKWIQQISLYMNTLNNTGVGTNTKSYVRLIYNIMLTLIRIHYADEPIVDFYGRTIWDADIASVLSKAYKFDFTEMGMDQKRFYTLWNTFFYGIGVEAFVGYDNITNTPIVHTIQPTSYIRDTNQDPNVGSRFHGFEMRATGNEILSMFADVDLLQLDSTNTTQLKKLESALAQGSTVDTEQNRKMTKQYQGLSEIDMQNPGNAVYYIYQHYTYVDGKPVLATFANNVSICIGAKELKPNTLEEKADPSRTMMPVIERKYSVYPGGFISIPDIMQDKQQAVQFLQKMEQLRAADQAMGGIFLYDAKKVKNINDINFSSIKPKAIPVDGEVTGREFMEVQKQRVTQDVVNMEQKLTQQAYQDCGVSEAQMGIQPQANRTATERQQLQMNANLKHTLHRDIMMRGERRFAELWLRSYIENYSGPKRDPSKMTKKELQSSKAKLILIHDGINVSSEQLFKDDFQTAQSLRVVVESKSERYAKNEKKKMAFMASANLILQNQSIGQSSKNFAIRLMLQLNGMSRDESIALVPYTVEEMIALDHVAMLNENIDIDGTETVDGREIQLTSIQSIDEDHMSFIYFYKRAIDTPAKYKAIKLRKRAMRRKQLMGIGQQQSPSVDGQTQAQVTSSMISKENSQIASLQDIA